MSQASQQIKGMEMAGYQGRWKTADVKVDQGVAWVTFSHPEKRNTISPMLNSEMVQMLEALRLDADARMLVLIGVDDAWTAGMDLEEHFREVDAGSEILQEKIRRDVCQWQWKLLRMYAKPAIAMVNDWCFGNGFLPLVACDPTIAADGVTLDPSEINWGIPPGNLANKAMVDTVGHRQALYYVTTGETFADRQAAVMGLVNENASRARLRVRTVVLVEKLLGKNPVVLHAAKHGFERSHELTWEQDEDYLYAKPDQVTLRDLEDDREQGLKQFLDDRSIESGLQTYKRARSGPLASTPPEMNPCLR